MLGAEIEHLLGLGDATDIRTGKHLGTVDERANPQSKFLRWQTDASHDATRLEQLKVSRHVNRSTNGVEYEIKLSMVITEEVVVAGGKGPRGSELFSEFRLAQAT